MITYKIFPEHKLLVVVTHSRETADVDYTYEVRETIRSDPEYSVEFCVLTDSRKLGDDQYVFDEIHYMATTQDVENPKVAVLVSSEVSFGVARTWQTLSERDHTEIEIFYDLDKALAWLGQKPEMAPIIEDMAKVTPV